MNPSVNKKFRIYAKRLLLTYSRVSPECSLQHILDELKTKWNFSNISYLIGKEKGQDGAIHYHVLLAHFERFQIRNPNLLDIEYKGQAFHGQYTPVKQLKQAVLYVCKGKEYITNLDNLYQGQLLSAREYIIKEVNEKGTARALMDYYNRTPDKAIAGLSLSALRRHFSDIKKLKSSFKPDQVKTFSGLDSLRFQPELQQWMQNPQKTLLLVEKSGLGKAQSCKAYVKHNKLKTLVVTHKENFKRLKNSYDAIIIDSANIYELKETQLLNLLDNQVDKSVNLLYNSVVKKAEVMHLISMNHKGCRKIAFSLSEKRFARKVQVQKPETPSIADVNTKANHVTNNTH